MTGDYTDGDADVRNRHRQQVGGEGFPLAVVGFSKVVEAEGGRAEGRVGESTHEAKLRIVRQQIKCS